MSRVSPQATGYVSQSQITPAYRWEALKIKRYKSRNVNSAEIIGIL